MTEPMGFWGVSLKRISWTSTDKRALMGRNADTEGFGWIGSFSSQWRHNTQTKSMYFDHNRNFIPNLEECYPMNSCCMLLYFLGGVAQTLTGVPRALEVRGASDQRGGVGKVLAFRTNSEERLGRWGRKWDAARFLQKDPKSGNSKNHPNFHGSWMFRVIFPMTQDPEHFFPLVFWSALSRPCNQITRFRSPHLRPAIRQSFAVTLAQHCG